MGIQHKRNPALYGDSVKVIDKIIIEFAGELKSE